MRFRLVAFADEVAPDLAGQIEAMQENGVELLEIRGVDGQNIDGISATKAKVIRKMLGFSGLAVWSLGSPFGKIGINDDFAPHLDSFKHSLELAGGIPVLWLLNNEEVNPPWGKIARIVV